MTDFAQRSAKKEEYETKLVQVRFPWKSITSKFFERGRKKWIVLSSQAEVLQSLSDNRRSFRCKNVLIHKCSGMRCIFYW